MMLVANNKPSCPRWAFTLEMQAVAEPPVVLSPMQHTALDDILRPHLRLEPPREMQKAEEVREDRTSGGKGVTPASRGQRSVASRRKVPSGSSYSGRQNAPTE